MTEQLMTGAEVARLLNVAPVTMRSWRHRNKGPKSIKLPNGSIRYRRADVEAWLRLYR